MPRTGLFALVAVILLGFPAGALADDAPARPPFAWPSAYSINWQRKCTAGDFTETYAVDGLHARSDTKSDKAAYTMIFNIDKQEAIVVMAGNVRIMPFSQLHLTSSAPPRPPFPTDGVWKNLGKDSVGGKPAVKYKVTPKPPASPLIVWLSEDGQTPLRLQQDTTDITFLSYRPGPQDPKLFEAPQK